MRNLSLALLMLFSAGTTKPSFAQTKEPDAPLQLAPAALPGKGLAQFDFFYAGEAKSRNMYIVQNGKITWSYIDSTGKGEISDAVLMTNGNVLFAHQFGITLIDHNKKVLWRYDAPDGCETHTAQIIGDQHVVFVQNGNPAKVFVMNILANKVVKEFPLPFTSGTHGQIRHARLTDKGTLLVAHMDLGKVCEYDLDGKELLSIDVPGVWSAVPLKNGNILVTSNRGFVREVSRNGSVVWDLPLKDVSGYTIANPQLAVRLSNGNTLINNWFNQWSSTFNAGNMPVQAIEVTPDKKVVWALRSWKDPVNLGPSTTIQLLNGPDRLTEKVHFGNIGQSDTSQPRIFEEGVISTGDYETHPAFSPSGDTLYFLKGLPDAGFFSICVSYKKNGKWSAPQIASFSGKYTDADPFVTRDGKTLYFVSNRPVNDGDPVKSDWDIWKTELTPNGWGKPIHLDSTINSSKSEYFPTLTDKGDLYFGSGRQGGKGRGDLYVSRLVNGRFAQPENLGDSINTPDNEYEPYIAPDGSYLIFMATYPNGLQNADFYISHYIGGVWTKAKRLPEPINSPVTEWGGKVTRDGKYFFFGSARNKINDVLPGTEDIKMFNHRLHSAGNGLGDIYYVGVSALK